MLSKKPLIVAFSVNATAFLVWLLVDCGSETEQRRGASVTQSAAEDTIENQAEQTTTSEPLLVGDTLELRRFNVTLNKAWVDVRTDTGNEFIDIDAGDGNIFVIVNATWENIDNQSRMAFPGNLVFELDGQEYTVESTESVLSEGWDMLLETLSPLERFTTNLVYKLPAREGMVGWWDFGGEDYFYLGEIPIGL